MTTYPAADTELFCVVSHVKKFHDFEEVSITWFMDKTHTAKDYAQQAAEEFFNGAEAHALLAYLKARHDATTEDTEIRRVELPLPSGSFPLGAMPCGGGVDILELWREPGYDLPFEVAGYFDMRSCTPLPSAQIGLSDAFEAPF